MNNFLKLICLLVLLSFNAAFNYAQSLEVGVDYTYTNIDHAALDATPGDTILVHEGSYHGGIQIVDLKGTEADWITIMAAENEEVIFQGGTNTQFSDAEYVEIKGFIFQGQTGNGLNIDDAGSIETPTHHIRVIDCTFRDIDASGNNDFLKLSGLDSFLISNCRFVDGAEGGSGIDMVGCHYGNISDNEFLNLGSNSIQAKGGTQFIRIERNYFENGGLRNINLGGSTGLQFFRPLDAPFEAADLQVYANIFIGGWAGLAYVGSTRVDVANNTFIMPENWVFRILQETVDPNRFVSCGDNLFRNNIIYYGDVHRDINIGTNTRPETFIMNNNLWFKTTDPNFNGPDLPVMETNSIIQEDPLFVDIINGHFNLWSESPAHLNGQPIQDLIYDFNMYPFFDPPSIGALEGVFFTSVNNITDVNASIHLFPNPAIDHVRLYSKGSAYNFDKINIYSLSGKLVSSFSDKEVDSFDSCTLPIDLTDGQYIIIGSVDQSIYKLGQFVVKNP